MPPVPARDPVAILNDCVRAVEDETGADVRNVFRGLSGYNLPAGDWIESLHTALSKNELVFQISEALAGPRPLHELLPELQHKVGRPVCEEEILCWLTLGAAARSEGRPLLRPVVHAFIRGISGAVVSFPESELGPHLWLAAEDEIKEGGGGRHEQERRKFLRIQVLREVTLSSRQSIGLEPWGRMKVEYEGLHAALPWIQEHAHQLGMPPEDLRDGVASLLDYLRRKRVLHDADREIFTKYWMDGDLEVQQGYLPQVGAPAGTKLRRGADEKTELVTQWLSERGETTIQQIAKKWGVPTEQVADFLDGLFRLLVDQHLLTPVRLKGSKGKPLPNVSGVYQVDADRLRLQQNHGVWRCKSCRRRMPRRTPRQACPAWRCDGELEFVREDPDNYDLQVLDQGYSMLRPEEHTAMVPHDERERLENLFKGDSDAINAFVCTPTLELGVDIGQLDAVLMRNVPPLPANYWQRAGRAGGAIGWLSTSPTAGLSLMTAPTLQTRSNCWLAASIRRHSVGGLTTTML